jgi:hypothetical protein
MSIKFLLKQDLLISMAEPNFVNPPWVYSPSEVEKWINATYPDHKVKKSSVEQSKKKNVLKNIEIVLDLDVEKKKLKPSSILKNALQKITNTQIIEEQFELLPTAELFVRALAQSKFHNMAKITMDNQIVYNHPEQKNDLRDTIQLLTDAALKQKNATNIHFIVYLDERKTCIAEITIQKVHPQKKHSVRIQFIGEIEEERFHRFLNYLRDHLSVDFTEERSK